MSKKSAPKPLSGGNTVSARSISGLESSLLNVLSTTTTTVTLNNVNITGGQINGVILGEIQTGQGFFTSLQVGKPDGTGGQACFYGNSVGDSACWLPVTGTWDIRGDISVRDISDLGNLRFSINTISSTNTNGNITISPNGTGNLLINSGINLNTISQNILFNTNNGYYSLNSNKNTFNSDRNTTLSTNNGSINLSTGNSTTNFMITFISTGIIITITTNTVNTLNVSDKIVISSSNSTPNINGIYTVNSLVSSTSFTIIPGFAVTNSGSSGFLRIRNDINLQASDSVNIPNGIPLEFSKSGIQLYNIGNNLNIDSIEDISLNPQTNINIGFNKYLNFGNSTINSDGTDLIINCDNKLVLNGDFHVNGGFSRLETEITTIKDPVITIGGVDPPVVSDIKDRGIEFRYHDGVNSKIGFFGKKTSTGCFTYIPDAINTNEVFTGNLGCVQFGSTSVTGLNLNSGKISDSIINFGTSGISDTKDKGFVFDYYDSFTRSGFIGWDSSSDCFKFLKEVTVIDSVVSGTMGNMCLGNTNITNLTVSGTITGTVLPNIERLYAAGGGFANPSINTEVTFVTITSSGIVTGILAANTIDGYTKKIFLSSCVSGGEFRLTCPSGRLLDPGSGTTASKTLKFSTAGQSIHLIWDAVISAYIIVNAGVCIY